MSEYIVRETDCGLSTKQEIVGELVRCKDCRHKKDSIHVMIQCSLHHTWFRPDHFCAYGEREEVKEDE